MNGIDKATVFSRMVYRQFVNVLRRDIQSRGFCHCHHCHITQTVLHDSVCRSTRALANVWPISCRRFKSYSKHMQTGSGRNVLPVSSNFRRHRDVHSVKSSPCHHMIQSRGLYLTTACQDDFTEDHGTNKTVEHGTSDVTDKIDDSGDKVDNHYDQNFVTLHLSEMDLNYTDGYTGFHTSCPKLGRRVNKKLPEDKRMYINSISGYFYCSHCKASGEWAQIKDNLTALKLKPSLKKTDCFVNLPVTRDVAEPSKLVTNTLSEAHPISQLGEQAYEEVINMFDWQEIKQGTMSAYGVKYSKSDDGYTLLLPVTSPTGVVIYIVKYTAIPSPEEGYITRKTTVPSNVKAGSVSTLFGWQVMFPRHRKEIVVTSSEVDAMAVYQMTGILALSLPSLTAFPQAVLPSMEPFSKITLWIGTSLGDWETAKQFAKKLNSERTYIFRPNTVKELPLDALQSGESLVNTVGKARPIGHKSIVQFENLKSDVYKQLANIEMYSGIKWTKYKPLNSLLKGHRRGELTILTGPTGSGKTTFVSDYSLDLCQHGVSTLWGSFEISNSRLARVMLTQYAGKNLTKYLSEFEEYAEEFTKLPMFYLTFRGEESETKVIEAMHHAVYVHDITHVVVDNLQFMMGMGYNITDRFFRQDQVVDLFRRFATEMNCHVTLIIHPRKELDDVELTLSSIFGSAKASQEADNVLILQRQKISAASTRTYIQVLKNRFDGTLGVMMMKFNKDSVSFTPVISKRKQKIDAVDDAEQVDGKSEDQESTIQQKQSYHG